MPFNSILGLDWAKYKIKIAQSMDGSSAQVDRVVTLCLWLSVPNIYCTLNIHDVNRALTVSIDIKQC